MSLVQKDTVPPPNGEFPVVQANYQELKTRYEEGYNYSKWAEKFSSDLDEEGRIELFKSLFKDIFGIDMEVGLTSLPTDLAEDINQGKVATTSYLSYRENRVEDYHPPKPMVAKLKYQGDLDTTFVNGKSPLWTENGKEASIVIVAGTNAEASRIPCDIFTQDTENHWMHVSGNHDANIGEFFGMITLPLKKH